MKQELIESLATHCDFYVGNEHSDKSHEERQRLFLEKYTELVVLECTNIVNKRKDAAIEASWCVDEAMSNAVWDIEAHFYGVEE